MTEDFNRQPVNWWSVGATIALAVSILVAAGVLILDRPPTTTVSILPPAPTVTPLPTQTPAPLSIYIIGAVANPQTVVELPTGSRIADAIAAAGGADDNADLQRINLAEPLQDGQMVAVPFTNAENDEVAPMLITVSPPTAATGASTGPVVNINTATLEELQTVVGIGPTIAQNIVEYRDANGPFTSVDELINVSRIGESTLENMRPYVIVE